MGVLTAGVQLLWLPTALLPRQDGETGGGSNRPDLSACVCVDESKSGSRIVVPTQRESKVVGWLGGSAHEPIGEVRRI